MEQEAREREKERAKGCLLGATETKCRHDVQTLDAMQALCLPLGASISLLIMFFFFDSMQMLFAVCTASKYYILFFIIGIFIFLVREICMAQIKYEGARHSSSTRFVMFSPISIRTFTFSLCVSAFLQGTLENGFVRLNLLSLEHKFGLATSQLAYILAGYDVATVLFLIPFVYFTGGSVVFVFFISQISLDLDIS
ncbi:signal peptide peptidase-like 3 [Diaphorina citri]|uniref:Signal peptide peptidase-like 3 n=1 Tax=Diaphorina citri TaxID=121845 RepID=A0A3Q0J3T2_DIACI|nr:signal peptide peptidase-like 3 [Diaphorina citri]